MDFSQDLKKNKKKQSRLRGEELSKEIERLESVIFGDTSKVIGEKKPVEKKSKRKISSIDDDAKDVVPKKTPVWQDDDDGESIQAAFEAQNRANIVHPGAPSDAYTSMLKSKFQSIHGTPKWAEIDRTKTIDSDESEDEDGGRLLQRCGNLIQKSKSLEKGKIKFKMLRSLNVTTEVEGPVVKSVEFHPTSSVGLVAGTAGIASLFEVDGKANAKLESIQFAKFCIDCAKFSADGNCFIVGSKFRRHFFYHDLLAGKSTKVDIHKETDLTNLKKFEVSPDGKLIAACGRFGNIMLLSGKTYEWIDTLTMNGAVQAICFSSDGSHLYSVGDDGNVYVWNLFSRRCVHRFLDDGCLKGTAVAISPDNGMLACGSSSGVVNIYNAKEALASTNPRPLKTFLNLTTRVRTLKFNHSSQLLAMASDKSNKSLKLAHCPSMTVYCNFPEDYNSVQTGIANSLSFSPNSCYLGVGTNIKKAFLYRLNHFERY